MIHPDTELQLINQDKGRGVVATSFIPKGTLTYVKDDLEIQIDADDPRLKDPMLRDIIETYSFIDADGTYVLSWDNAKYVNHCCHCNTMSSGYGFEIAIRDIEAGEEITDEYGMFNFSYTLKLKCKKMKCRNHVNGQDLNRYHETWDETIKSALQYFEKVSQPLLPFLNKDTRQDLLHYLKNGDGYKSVLSLRCSKG